MHIRSDGILFRFRSVLGMYFACHNIWSEFRIIGPRRAAFSFFFFVLLLFLLTKQSNMPLLLVVPVVNSK